MGKGKAIICPHPFDSRLPPNNSNDKKALETLHDQYNSTGALAKFKVPPNTSFTKEVKFMLWRYLNGRQGLQVFHHPNIDHYTSSHTGKKTYIKLTGNATLVTEFGFFSSLSVPPDNFDINMMLLGAKIPVLLALTQELKQFTDISDSATNADPHTTDKRGFARARH
jgi:hypothetical protein